MSASVRSKFVGSRARFIFSVLAVTVFSALVQVGCSKENGGGNLVCGEGEAWVNDADDESALIFQSNGEVLSVFTKGGTTWRVAGDESGTYSTSGNKLTVRIEDETVSMTYSVSGNKLTLTFGGEGSDTYTKKSGINPVYY
jgi:hypothetical protein